MAPHHLPRVTDNVESSTMLPRVYDWNALRVFLAIHRGGSLKAAARELGVSVSTVSRRLSGLEQELGVELFRRLPEGLEPTGVAERIVVQAQQVEQAAYQIDRDAAEHEDVAGVVRVAALPNFGSDILAPALPLLYARYAKLVVELQLRVEVADLRRAEAEIGIRYARPSDGDLVVQRLTTVDYGLFCSARGRDAGSPSSVATEALSELRWVGWPEHLGFLPEASWLTEHVPQAQFVLRCDDVATAIQACAAGLGVALLARPVAQRYPDLCELSVELALPELPLWLTARSKVRNLPRVAAVWDFLLALCQGESLPGQLAHMRVT